MTFVSLFYHFGKDRGMAVPRIVWVRTTQGSLWSTDKSYQPLWVDLGLTKVTGVKELPSHPHFRPESPEVTETCRRILWKSP